MRILEQIEIKLDWSDIYSRVQHPRPQSHIRTPGVHLSGVLRYIALQSGILKPFAGVDSTPNSANTDSAEPARKGVIQDIDEEEFPLRMALGMAFEDWMVGLYPNMIWQPGELERDGVFGTMDGLTQDGETVIVEEFKLTWKSEWNYGREKFLNANWLWMQQAKGYHALAQDNLIPTDLITRFHVGWVNGDYRPPSPKFMRYTVEFSQKEVDATWAMVLRNKDEEGVEREG